MSICGIGMETTSLPLPAEQLALRDVLAQVLADFAAHDVAEAPVILVDLQGHAAPVYPPLRRGRTKYLGRRRDCGGVLTWWGSSPGRGSSWGRESIADVEVDVDGQRGDRLRCSSRNARTHQHDPRSGKTASTQPGHVHLHVRDGWHPLPSAPTEQPSSPPPQRRHPAFTAPQPVVTLLGDPPALVQRAGQPQCFERAH